MFKTLKKGLFPFLIAFSALSVSASAAFYSVSGLSKLFAGASFEVIIMAGSLEFSKLVIASLLYQYWDTINKWLRTYLTIAAVTLVLITSMGIYGFLSAAYQETYQKLVVQQNEIEFLDNKAQFYEDDVTRYDQELERISANIATLSNARSQQIQVRDTTVAGGVRTTISTSELRLAQGRIEVEEDNRKAVQAKREVAADSLQNIKLKILDLQNQSDTVGELGPLQYLSGLTGTPMDKIINWLLLVIIFVFDPLAISLVVAANFAFDRAFPSKSEDDDLPVEPDPDDDPDSDGYDDYDEYDNPSSVYYDEEYDEGDWKEGILDEKPNSPPPFDIQAQPTKEAQAWYDIADKLAEDSAAMADDLNDLPWEKDPEVQAFLEAQDEPGPWSEEDDKIHTIGGLTNDKESGFMDFQKKMDENDEEWDEEHALDQVLNDMVEQVEDDLWEAEDEIAEAEDEIAEAEDEIAKIDVIDPEQVSTKFEVEDTAGNVEVYEEESTVDETEMETDRTGTFPNQINPTSVGAIVQKIETPHLPNEDDLFKQAMRDKAEQDKQQFLNNANKKK